MVAIGSTLIVIGAISAYKLGEASYHIAKDGVNSALHTSQKVIEKTLKWGTVTILEGIGQPYHDYQKKWEKEKLTPIQDMEIKIISTSSEPIENNQKFVHVVIEVVNTGTTPLNLNNLLSQEFIVLTDKKNNTYSLNALKYQDSTIKVGKSLLRQMDIVLPKDVELHQLSTPMKQLLLEK